MYIFVAYMQIYDAFLTLSILYSLVSYFLEGYVLQIKESKTMEEMGPPILSYIYAHIESFVVDIYPSSRHVLTNTVLIGTHTSITYQDMTSIGF